MKSVIDLAEQVKDYAAAGKTIAPVENGTTAVGSYAIGEKFIREGVLYKAKTSITAGDTLTLNTNYELEDNVVTQISDVKQALSDEVVTRAKLGAHNLGKKFNGITYIGLTIKDAPDGGNYINGTSTGPGGRLGLKSDNFVLKAGTYSIVGESNDHSKYSSVVLQKTSDNSVLGSYLISNGAVDKSQATFTLATDTECYFGFNTANGVAYGTDTFIIYPMVKLADDKDDTFYPYAMTNKELTDVAKQTVGTYAELQLSESISVTADGTKTFKQLWNELILAWNAMLDSNVGTVFRPKGFDLAGITIPTFDRTTYHKYSSTSKQTLYFTGVYITSNGFSINEAYLNTTASSCRMKKCTNGTTEDMSETVPTSGNVYTIYFDSYKQIS